MNHDPKLSAYVIKLNTIGTEIEKTNRNLFKHKIGNLDSDLQDSFIFLEICRKFIEELDTEQMYSDDDTKKSMTANQVDIESDNVNTSVRFHSASFVIEGIVEGGAYGKRRKKTSTSNKSVKSEVSEGDAITDDFYFLIYTPLESSKSILLIQSYADDNIDSVMKKFWRNFFTITDLFRYPSISKYIPDNIIQDFKNGATVSNLVYTTEIPSSSLLGSSINFHARNFRITVKIEPTEEGLSYTEFDDVIGPIGETMFNNFRLGAFNKKKGLLRDSETGKGSPFQLGNDFKIKPSIILSKYISIENDESDFERIKDFSFGILERIKQEVYPRNAVQER